MRKLAKIAAPALAAIAVLGAISPASAQSYTGHGYSNQYERGYNHSDRDDYRGGWRDDRGQARSLRNQIDQLQNMVERRDGRDRISEREAAGLRREVYSLRSAFNSYNRNGLSRGEVRTLQDRIQRVRARLQFETRDRDGRRW